MTVVTGATRGIGLCVARELARAGACVVLAARDEGRGAAATSAPQRRFVAVTNRLIAQGADDGALPVLYAATSPGPAGGASVGPGGWFGLRGRPASARASAASRDPDVARHL